MPEHDPAFFHHKADLVLGVVSIDLEFLGTHRESFRLGPKIDAGKVERDCPRIESLPMPFVFLIDLSAFSRFAWLSAMASRTIGGNVPYSSIRGYGATALRRRQVA